MGRNGAGKTTTIESAMGLLSVRAGRVTLQGRDITRLPTHQRARLGIGYAPEDAGIFPDLTVAENFQISRSLAAGRRGRRRRRSGDGRARPRPLPRGPQFLERRGLNLSGGQKKMVAIARALTLSPSILLLDEPFEGLAPVVVSRFIEATRRIKEMGVSLLIAESNLATASRIADRLYAIDRGEIIFQGDPPAALAERRGHAHAPRLTRPPAPEDSAMRHAARSWLRRRRCSRSWPRAPSTPRPGAGAASAPLSAEEEASLQEIRDFVQATAAAVPDAGAARGLRRVVGRDRLPAAVRVEPRRSTPRGALYVNRRLLRASNRDLVIAKSLAYEMLRAPSKATTLAERERERAAAEPREQRAGDRHPRPGRAE